MNDVILKSYDNIMYQQEKMDNKAYIFLGFIGLFLSLGLIEFNSCKLDVNLIIYLILLIIPLLLSLFPIANKMSIRIMMYCHFRFFGKEKKLDHNNIFYFSDIYYLSKSEYIDVLKEFYSISNISESEEYLIEQILINAKILKIKVTFHSIAQLAFILILITSCLIIIIK